MLMIFRDDCDVLLINNLGEDSLVVVRRNQRNIKTINDGVRGQISKRKREKEEDCRNSCGII